jgi:HPt (histidine-containing phosphotransfer) domain-containing protein
MNDLKNPQVADVGPLLDARALENLRALRVQGEPDPFAELVALFIEDTPVRMAQIRQALKRGVAHDLEAAAHSLRGSASNLGAATMAASCGTIMQLARKNELGPVAALVEKIEADFGKVKPALLEELKR